MAGKLVPSLLMGSALARHLAHHGADWEVSTLLTESLSIREVRVVGVDSALGRFADLCRGAKWKTGLVEAEAATGLDEVLLASRKGDKGDIPAFAEKVEGEDLGPHSDSDDSEGQPDEDDEDYLELVLDKFEGLSGALSAVGLK